jgi:hypothetical protein
MSETDADHFRYRALLKAADDEAKRLALIQLLIEERARDKLAEQSKLAFAKTPLLESLPLTNPVLRQEVTLANVSTQPSGTEALATADDVSQRFAALAMRVKELTPRSLESHTPHSHREPEPRSVARSSTEAVVDATRQDPPSSDDLARKIAELLSRHATKSIPAAEHSPAIGSSPSGTDAGNSSVSRIGGASAESLREATICEEPKIEASLPSSAAFETAHPTASASATSSANDLVERIANLLSRRATAAAPTATTASYWVAPPSGDEARRQVLSRNQAVSAEPDRR